MSRGDNSIPQRRETLLHHGRKFDYVEVEAATRGVDVRRQFIRHPGAVVVLPLLETPTGLCVVMIRQRRHSVDRVLMELPAGTLERGEDPRVAGARELEEETGFRAARVEPLACFLTSPGLSDERMWAFVASELQSVGQRLEEDEDISVEIVPVSRALEAVSGGDIEDAKSMLTLLLAARQGWLAKHGVRAG